MKESKMFKEAFLMAIIIFFLGGAFSLISNSASKVVSKTPLLNRYIFSGVSDEELTHENSNKLKSMEERLERLEESSERAENVNRETILKLKAMKKKESLAHHKMPNTVPSLSKQRGERKTANHQYDIDDNAPAEVKDFEW